MRLLLHFRTLNTLLDVLVRCELGQPQHFIINVALSLSAVGIRYKVHLYSIDLLLDGIQLEYGLMIDLHLWQLPRVDDSHDDNG